MVCRSVAFAVLLFAATTAASAQAFRIDSLDPRLTPLPLQPTSLDLSREKLQPKTRQQLIRIMQAEEAFTLRALPLGHRGLTLQANGGVAPDGSDYLKDIQEYGVSAKPGARVHVSDIHISGDKVVLELNGGPDKRHKWLQHISVGASGGNRQLAPNEDVPIGARVTLVFKDRVPEMTGQQLKQLFSPLLDFSLKSPLEAYTDTLPPLIRQAVKEHRVLVGMDREMVLYALSQPDRKVREQGPDGWDYEEWIYGKPPQDVQFVRFVGDRVSRVEISAIGKEPIIRDHDETNGYLAKKSQAREHTIAEGDAPASADLAQRKPPSLLKPGEPQPSDPNQPQAVKTPGQAPSQTPAPSPSAPAPPNPSGSQFASLRVM